MLHFLWPTRLNNRRRQFTCESYRIVVANDSLSGDSIHGIVSFYERSCRCIYHFTFQLSPTPGPPTCFVAAKRQDNDVQDVVGKISKQGSRFEAHEKDDFATSVSPTRSETATWLRREQCRACIPSVVNICRFLRDERLPFRLIAPLSHVVD